MSKEILKKTDLSSKKMDNINEIKCLINKELLTKYVNTNKDDGYGNACTHIAINVMRHLDNFKGEFNIGYSPDMTTPHGIICKCDDQGGITGFMAGIITNIVTKCYKSGWKFYLSSAISEYDIGREEHIEKYINNITATGLVSHEEAKAYVDSLIKRFKSKIQIQGKAKELTNNK